METVAFVGGLGDILHQVWTSDRYVRLSRPREGVRAKVVVSCPNPGAKELFAWHPKASTYDLVEVPFHGTWSSDVWSNYGVEEEIPPLGRDPSEPIEFYQSSIDYGVQSELKGAPYLVFAISAGTDDRNIPADVATRATETALKYGYKILVVGRTYAPIFHESVRPNDDVHRHETRLPGWDGVVDGVDRLSVPGTLEAIRGAAGFFGAHSSMCVASWHLRKPTFVLLPRSLYGGFRVHNAYTFGRDYPETFHGEFLDWTKGFFSAWLDRLPVKARPS